MDIVTIVYMICFVIALLSCVVFLFVSLSIDEKRYLDKKRYYESVIEMNKFRTQYYNSFSYGSIFSETESDNDDDNN